MKIMKKLFSTLTLAAFLLLSAPNMAVANDQGTERGDDVTIAFDLLFLRPLGFLATGVGVVVFVGSLPISIPTLSVQKAFNALVVNPAQYTFVRQLGADGADRYQN